MRYAVVIEKAVNNYSAYVPDLPGCVATGATIKETEHLLREAIELHLIGLRRTDYQFRHQRAKSSISRWQFNGLSLAHRPITLGGDKSTLT